MKINWNIIDSMLIGEINSEDLPISTREEAQKFLEIHDMRVFSEESLELLAGIWDLAYKSGYEKATGQKIPNVFRSIRLDEEEENEH